MVGWYREDGVRTAIGGVKDVAVTGQKPRFGCYRGIKRKDAKV
jgi:hypothetical protein